MAQSVDRFRGALANEDAGDHADQDPKRQVALE